MPSDRAIRVEGVSELRRAFNRADKKLGRDLAKTLKAVGEPVRVDAERNVLGGISRIGIRWYRMRIGISRSIVYVAPKERGRQSRANPRLRRPRLADQMGPEMERALDANVKQAEAGFLRLLDDVGKEWERG